MLPRRRVWLAAAITVAVLGVLMFFSPQPYQLNLKANGCGPGQTEVCWEEFNTETGEYEEECECCDSGSTPGATGEATYAPVTPPPTATPFPDNTVSLCAPDACDSGDTRLMLIYYTCDPACYPQYAVPVEPCCGPSCPCEQQGGQDQYCTPGNGFINCSQYSASVHCDLPAWHADREPYPRALVTMPETVWVVDRPTVTCWGDPVDPDSDCNSSSPSVGTTCNYKLGLKIEPGSQQPTWNFEDCGTRYGPRVQCSWNKSSWGKPAQWGDPPQPGCGFVQPLPAYRVTAWVPYWWSVGRQWDEWEQVGEDCDCTCVSGSGSDECSGSAGECIYDDEHWDQDCDPIYDWVHHGPNWERLDLTEYGHATPYMPNGNVQLVSHPPCEPNPPVGVLNIPCIEVQAPIEEQP